MDADLVLQILAGGSASTLAAVLLAWIRCEQNHKALRQLLEKSIEQKGR